MSKTTLLRTVATFGLLTAGYLGYDQGFDLLAARIGHRPAIVAGPKRPATPMSETRTSREATELAVRGFGKGHWSAEQSTLRLYEKDKGYWMYAGSQVRSKDGKRWTFAPFALISMSRDGKALKTMIGKQAVLDFDQPIGVTARPGAGSSHVVRARIIGEVVIRDDKGTRSRADDLTIGPLSYLEYVEDPSREPAGPIPQARVAAGDPPGPRIQSDSHVVIHNVDQTFTADGLRIDLIPTAPSAPGGSTGFNGARTAWLLSNVRVHLDDVGSSGILPGSSPPPKGATPDKDKDKEKDGDAKVADKAAKDGTPASPPKTPLDLHCDGPMRVDLARPRPPIKWGPPAPPGPVRVFFTKNVEVTRGAADAEQPPSQLNSDNLDLTLIQADRTPQAPPEPTADGDDAAPAPGPMEGLTLRRARADGHAVWLQSPADGLSERGNELILEKNGPGEPDVTRLNADAGKNLWIEKIDRATQGPDKGKITSVSVIETRSATIHQMPDAAGTTATTIVAEGPGTLETRPERDRPIERTASWQDRLIVLPEGQGEQARQVIVLTGAPTIQVVDEFDLAARRSIKIWLRPSPKDKDKKGKDGAVPGLGAATAGGDASKIEKLEALEAVHLVATGKPPAGPNPDDTPLPKRTMDARKILVVHFDPPPAPPKPAPKADAAAGAPAVAAAEPAKPAAKEDEAPPRDPEPDMDVTADTVWAWILPGRDAKSRGELREARMEGEVELHQGPSPGKTRGTDLAADKAQVVSDGPGKAQLLARGTPSRPAEAATEEFTIQGPFLGLEQARDYAWVQGRGRLIQHPAAPKPAGEGEEKDDRDEPPPDDGAPRARGPVVVTWNVPDDAIGMEFFGRGEAHHKKLGGPGTPLGPAEARFKGDVEAIVDDSRMFCDEMLAVMDKGVSFVKPAKDPKAKTPAAAEPRPQLAGVRCEGDVDIFSRKTDPDTGALVELQRVSGEVVTFQRKTGRFQVLTPGIVRLYSLPDDPDKPAPGRDPKSRGTVARVAARPSGDARKDQGKGKQRPRPEGLVLTRIQFRGSMEGQFTETAKGKAPGPRTAQFHRAVEVVRGKVANEDEDLRVPGDEAALFRRHPDAVVMRSDVLNVENVPPPPLRLKKGQKPPADAPKARNFMRAQAHANARTKDTAIQGDEIRYNSESEIFFVYGAANRGVTIVQQPRAGQPPSVTQGRAARFNRLTGAADLIQPETIQFVDANTGIRPGVAGTADPFPKKERPKRKDATLPGRSNRERRNFTGGQY